ncbi:HIRAN domain-containing protein [Sorangium sp. So ce1014]|uniref:HIRAN domain-containing protein n=1 Tax=Sorangium sp. So ce1014 TaxID=3133326 RepID=UPI003F624072
MIDPTPVLYLAWQDAASRRWFPVGRLRRLPQGMYEFVYIRGFEAAQRESGMQPILGFGESAQRYLSDALFPQFQNRIMSRSREDYPVYIERLGFREEPRDPLEILARSGGRKPTDSFAFQLFPAPSRIVTQENEHRYMLSFFVHGLRYVRPEARERSSRASLGEKLFLLSDWQNPVDPGAIMIRTEDNHLLGWVPRVHCADIHELRRLGQGISLTVAHVNPESTPSWLGVLCRLESPWPEGFAPLSAPEYQPIAEAADL